MFEIVNSGLLNTKPSFGRPPYQVQYGTPAGISKQITLLERPSTQHYKFPELYNYYALIKEYKSDLDLIMAQQIQNTSQTYLFL